MARLFFFLGALLAGTSVGVGAWAAHAADLQEQQALWLDKAADYQMVHALALLCTALLLVFAGRPARLAVAAGFCFLAGIVLFCGSLYCMAVTSADAGLITPAGGVLLLAGWFLLALSAPVRR